ncbi:hypothetical protein Tco_0167830 [Tanacetum coccineum]
MTVIAITHFCWSVAGGWVVMCGDGDGGMGGFGSVDDIEVEGGDEIQRLVVFMGWDACFCGDSMVMCWIVWLFGWWWLVQPSSGFGRSGKHDCCVVIGSRDVFVAWCVEADDGGGWDWWLHQLVAGEGLIGGWCPAFVGKKNLGQEKVND